MRIILKKKTVFVWLVANMDCSLSKLFILFALKDSYKVGWFIIIIIILRENSIQNMLQILQSISHCLVSFFPSSENIQSCIILFSKEEAMDLAKLGAFRHVFQKYTFYNLPSIDIRQKRDHNIWFDVVFHWMLDSSAHKNIIFKKLLAKFLSAVSIHFL